ncbi:MAG TPA: Xaa-Pro peptidase family protein, partial [Candidatus Limnocylindrales bacterium]|nr:Xaa-Pro peptidase family protein [Candidatus Limnocylindrales bacterium]
RRSSSVTAVLPAARPATAARPLGSPGSMTVDWEERVNPERLRSYRFARSREALEASQLGALLAFDFNNIRYLTSTHIGEWARDKMTRFALLTRGGDPHLWDFGSAAKHHRLHCPWLPPENVRGGMIGLRGAVAPDAGLFTNAAREIAEILRAEGVADMPLGVDIVEPPMLAALEAEGIAVRDGQQTMLDAREVKSVDEITLLNTACAMVDGAYQLIAERLKPGVRESQLVAEVTKALFDMGSEHVDNINAVSGERCSPHPHVFSDRLIRPGDQAFFDIIQTYVGYKTCYYRTFSVGTATDAQRDAYKRAREWIDASIELMRPGVTTDRVASVWPRADEFGFDSEMECFGLQFGHGVGLFLHERPIISRLNSLEHPVELKEGMVIALETYCPAKDGYSAARIEEEVVVTADGPQVITRFPSQDLFVANEY